MMLKLRASKIKILRIIAILLILSGVSIACVWYYVLFSRQRQQNPLWNKQFTPQARWEAIQKSIHLYGWKHYDSNEVGHYGSKDWVTWIMARANEGDSLFHCGVGHKHTALELITNNSCGFFGCRDAWLKWWQENKSKSQLQWIQEGFANFGVIATKAPSETEQKELLTLLGGTCSKEKKKIPEFIRYNAFRWLRDTGFDPLDYVISKKNRSLSPEIEKGLKAYQYYNGEYPRQNYLGLLQITGKETVPWYEEEPQRLFFSREIQILGNILITIPILGGFLMLYWLSGRSQSDQTKESVSIKDEFPRQESK